MSGSVWPMLLDISKEDCKRLLRRLELDAYASLLSAFRAQGDLTKDKKKVLQELCTILGISTERHRAEVRRVVNDERLATVADVVGGCSDYSEWAVEGRRLVPLMPRLVPQTAFTNIANANAAIAAQQNACLPQPSTTKNIKENLPVAASNTFTVVNGTMKMVAAVDEQLASSRISPTRTGPTDSEPFLTQHEVVVSTSTVDAEDKNSFELNSVNIEDSLSDTPQPKRKRTVSDDSVGAVTQIVLKTNTPAPTASASSSPAPSSRTVNIPISGPLQFTLTGNPSKLTANTTSALSSMGMYPAQKVFLVSTSCANLPSSILQRSLSVPVVKTVTGTNSCITVSSQSTGRPTSSSLITPISSSTPVSLVLSSASASSTFTTSQSGSGGTSLKIIAQTVPVSAASKLGSKLSLGSGLPPIVVVTKTSVGKACQPGTRLVNVIGAQSTAGRSGPSLVTIGPKGKQTALVKVAPGMSLSAAMAGKPNVYVVQKSQMLQQFKQSQPVSAFAISASSFSGTQTMLKSTSLSQNKGVFKLPAVAGPKSQGPISATATSSGGGGGEVSVSRKSSVLADLLQAAGILPDGGGSGAVPVEVGHSYLTDQSMVRISGDNQNEETTIDISSLVDQLKGKETVNVFNQSCFGQSPEIIIGQQKLKAKLTKFESGILDPKTGRFAPFPVTISNDRHETTGGAVPKGTTIDSLSLQSIHNSPVVQGSTLRRELLAGKDECRPQPSTAIETASSGAIGESFSQPVRTFLYTGATYSKGDVASHRKKANDGASPGEDEVVIASTGHQVGVEETMPEQEVQFTDDNLMTVVEETVVTTDDIVPVGVEADVGSKSTDATMDYAVAVAANPVPQISTFVTNRQMPVKVVASRANTHSGSSVFMVSDSSFGSSDSSQLGSVEQGLCGIAGLEGEAETLEIIGSTEDFESVESRVAALHGEDDASEVQESFVDIHVEGNLAKKKKASEEPASSSLSTGWYRAATALLHRVMKYRGPNRFKGELSAAHWFLHPVSAEDAPGYHKIVLKPMDFTTILKKLEKFAYKDIKEFHDDMLLVKRNCELYNPDDHPARQDCEHVFTFYQQEYNKLTQKFNFITSPQKKRKI